MLSIIETLPVWLNEVVMFGFNKSTLNNESPAITKSLLVLELKVIHDRLLKPGSFNSSLFNDNWVNPLLLLKFTQLCSNDNIPFWWFKYCLTGEVPRLVLNFEYCDKCNAGYGMGIDVDWGVNDLVVPFESPHHSKFCWLSNCSDVIFELSITEDEAVAAIRDI